MKILKVTGGNTLSGGIEIQGSKNAVLPVLAASLLTEEKVRIYHCPRISDVADMLSILEYVGCKCVWHKDCLELQAACLNNEAICGALTRNLRASILFLGALLARKQEVKLAYPGGCKIGARPIDIHLDALARLGVALSDENGEICAKGKLHPGHVNLKFPSVGATENLLLAAALSEGTVHISDAAREPEIVALCEFLTLMGAEITGAGSREIEIHGKKRLHGAEYTIPADRIVAGTYALAALACGGNLQLHGSAAPDLAGQYPVIAKAGAHMFFRRNTWHVEASGYPKSVGSIRTGPFPSFPTDMQSPMLAAMLRSEGCTSIADTIYPERFGIVGELRKMGADVSREGTVVRICGTKQLHAAALCAGELRGAAGLVIAGLQSEGETVISGVPYIERGYEDICRDLQQVGADIRMEETGVFLSKA